MKYRPFSHPQLNNLENFSLISSTVTIYCGLYYLSAKQAGEAGYDEEKDCK